MVPGDIQPKDSPDALLGDLASILPFVNCDFSNPAEIERFETEGVPEGMTSGQAWTALEWVRKLCCGVPACGKVRDCGMPQTWVALTPDLTAALFRVEHLGRGKGALLSEVTSYISSNGYYPPRLSDTRIALESDGVKIDYEDLAALARGRSPEGSNEQVAARALRLLSRPDPGLDVPLLANEIFDAQKSLDEACRGSFPAIEPIYKPKYFCPLTGPQLFEEFARPEDSQTPALILVLLASSHCFHQRPFPHWNDTLSLFVTKRLFESIGAPLLQYLPIRGPYLACGNALKSYGTIEGPHGHDHTPAFSMMLHTLENGLKDLSGRLSKWREDQRKFDEAIKGDARLTLRQKGLLKSLSESPMLAISAAEYAERCDIATSTAYTDLHKLVTLGYLTMRGDNGRMTFSLRGAADR